MSSGRWTCLVPGVIAVVAGVLLAACADGAPAGPRPSGPGVSTGAAKENLVRARRQSGDGVSVLVDHVVLKVAGYVAIHADGGGAPGPVIGASPLLAAGAHDEVAVEVAPKLASGATTVWPVLHAEDNGNKVFDYPGADQPVTFGTGGEVVVVPIVVTVP